MIYDIRRHFETVETFHHKFGKLTQYVRLLTHFCSNLKCLYNIDWAVAPPSESKLRSLVESKLVVIVIDTCF